jgi:hypothetical protein
MSSPTGPTWERTRAVIVTFCQVSRVVKTSCRHQRPSQPHRQTGQLTAGCTISAVGPERSTSSQGAECTRGYSTTLDSYPKSALSCESAGQSSAPVFLDTEEVRGSNPLAPTTKVHNPPRFLAAGTKPQNHSPPHVFVVAVSRVLYLDTSREPSPPNLVRPGPAGWRSVRSVEREASDGSSPRRRRHPPACVASALLDRGAW